jgi:hypothetical protein
MKGEERGRGKIQAECRRQRMRPTHTPRDRSETAWRGHSLACRGSCRVKVRWESNLLYILGRWGSNLLYILGRWGGNLLYILGRCGGEGLYEL